MEIAHLRFLLSAEGQRLLEETAAEPITPQSHLQKASHLRRQVEPALAQAILETIALRQAAAAKFSRAERMLFTRAALEQASNEEVALHRAAQVRAAGLEEIIDLGCGIGGDALALGRDAAVIGLERDLLRLLMARHNVSVYGQSSRFWPVQADLADVAPMPVQALFCDPARRDASGRRLRSVYSYEPPLPALEPWLERVNAGCVKVSPAIDYAEIPAGAEIEFVSLRGELKEGILWFGALRSGLQRRATLLPAGVTLSEADYPGAPVAVSAPAAFLYEPDSAVIRAHLVQPLARCLEATQIDPQIAYLTADRLHQTLWARAFALEAWFPFQLKRLRAYLREHNVGQVIVKKRGSPIEPEALRSQLRLRGEEERVLFLTHVQGQPAVLIGHEV